MWKITTQFYDSFAHTQLFGSIMLGYMVNNFLPLKGGELFRAHYLTKIGNISLSAALSMVCIERIFDVISLGLLLVIAICFNLNLVVYLSPTPFFLTIILLAVLIYSMRCECVRNSVLIKKVGRIVSDFLKPIKYIFNVKIILLLLSYSAGAWLCNYFSLLILLQAIGQASFAAALILLLTINIGLLIPASPGSFGIMQLAFLAALVPFGIEKQYALILSFAYQAGLYISTVLIGAPFLIKFFTIKKSAN
jgi:uncharacterized protein (TIRG00374 family)